VHARVCAHRKGGHRTRDGYCTACMESDEGTRTPKTVKSRRGRIVLHEHRGNTWHRPYSPKNIITDVADTCTCIIYTIHITYIDTNFRNIGLGRAATMTTALCWLLQIGRLVVVLFCFFLWRFFRITGDISCARFVVSPCFYWIFFLTRITCVGGLESPCRSEWSI